jgi:hypothetical protein
MKPSARCTLLGIAGVAVFLLFWFTAGHLALLSTWAQGPAAWKTHEDPMGFSVSVPPGWSARGDRNSGRAEIQGGAGESVVVWPVFLASPSGTQAAFDAGTASAVIRRLAGKLWPDAQWEPVASAGPSAARLHGRRGDAAVVCLFTWIPSPKGTAAYFYATSAPTARYRSLEETFARILTSFHVAGTPAPAAAVNYVRWTDPKENAFSLEVPVGWQVRGGLFRFASVDTRPMVEAASPDGEIRITLGDAEIPPFTEPNPYLAMAGFNEGSWYSPGYGVRMLVRRYVPGTAFAVEYVRNKVARGCAELSLLDTRERPDAVQAINQINAQYGMAMRLTAGETSFTCRRDARMLCGYYFVATQLTQAGGPGLWNVQYLFGGVATPEKAQQGQAVLEHMIKTFELNPQWFSMQQNITANTSRIVSRTHQEISSLISDTYWSRQKVMDEIDRRRSNVILGLEDIIDTATGQQIKVESGSAYYWIDQRGTIVGTDTYTRPNLDFRELIRLP